MDTVLLVVLIVVLIVVIFVILIILGNNKIVKLEQEADKAWSDIDIEIKRTASLIPNLVNVLKGAVGAEQKLLIPIVNSISSAYANLFQVYNNPSSGHDEKVRAAAGFFATLYPIVLQLPSWPVWPQLQSLPQFRELWNDIRVSIDKIANAEKYYNDAAKMYNTAIQTFPWSIAAMILHKKRKEYFEYKGREEAMRRIESGELTAGLQF
ncbi:MAG: LemA family protein [Nanopusillaceae archaeon]